MPGYCGRTCKLHISLDPAWKEGMNDLLSLCKGEVCFSIFKEKTIFLKCRKHVQYIPNPKKVLQLILGHIMWSI